MKKWLALMVAMLLAAVVGAWAEDAQGVLTAEPWKLDTSSLTFLDDGTGKLTNAQGMTFDITWTLKGSDVTYTFDFYGKHTVELTLGDQDGVPALALRDGSATWYPESRYAELAAASNAGLSLYPAALGEEINLGFVKMRFTGAEVTSIIGGDSMWYPASDGMQFFCLVGHVENTSGMELAIDRLCAEMTFDGQYTYNASAAVVTNGMKQESLPALTKAEYRIYAEIPDKLVDSLNTCAVRFALKDNFTSRPAFLGEGSFAFEVALDGDVCAQAKKGPAREMTYFEESPALPVPTSYVDVYQSGSNVHSTNGRTTRISYRYTVRTNQDKAADTFKAYLEALKKDGYTVKESGGKYTVLTGSVELATVTISSSTLEMDIRPGNEKLKPGVKPTEKPAAAAYTLGDTIRTASAEMTLEKTGTAKQLYSSITKRSSGICHYYEPVTGDSLMYVSGTIRNIGSTPIDIRHIYCVFTFDGQYSYAGDVDGVKKDAADFIHDLSPMTSVSYYCYADVPSSVLNSYKECVVSLGFTDDFDVKFVSGTTNLDDFTHCDQVFEVKLTRGGKTSAAVKTDTPAAKETASGDAAGMESAAQEEPKAEEPTYVFAFESASYTVAAKGTLKLKPVLQGAEVQGQAKYTWTSSDTAVAKVTNGTVTGVKAGSCTITCSMSDKSGNPYTASCEVVVTQPVTGIKREKETVTVAAGGTFQLNPTVSPASATNPALRFSSSDTNIATVDDKGVVTGKQTGKCTITMEAADGSGKSARQPVSVVPFVIDMDEIVLTERETYKLELPYADPISGMCIKFEKGCFDVGNVSTASYMRGGYNVLLNWAKGSTNYITIHPKKAGTVTLYVMNDNAFFGVDSPRVKYPIKIKVEHSAVYDSTSFPKLEYSKAMADAAAYLGEQVSLSGVVVQAEKESNLIRYTVATKGSHDNQLVVTAPARGSSAMLNPGEKVTVYGAFAEAESQTTETGLSRVMLVVEAEKINDSCFNSSMTEPKVEYWD